MTLDSEPAPVLPHVVQQHAEEASLLRHTRTGLVRAPHVGLELLGRHDERIEAHLDGLLVAGTAGKRMAQQQLLEDVDDAGASFSAAVLALRQRDHHWLYELLAASAEAGTRQRGLVAAFGWVAPEDLRGVVQQLLNSGEPHHCQMGVEACRLHRVDPGESLVKALENTDAPLRSAAWRCAGELGRIDLLDAAQAALSNEPPGVAFWAAWAACLLGDRDASLQVLATAARQADALAERALALALIASPFDEARELAHHLSAAAAGQPRCVLRVVGLLGDARFVPWLLDCMEAPAVARLAGEALSWISGADLARDGLETLTAPPLPELPSDDPDDEETALDEDDDLPWPDVARLHAWWARSHELQAAAASGTRLFAGAGIGATPAARVLRDGSQRMRSLAALWLCVLQPGRVLFPVAAPAARQQRWLAEDGGFAPT